MRITVVCAGKLKERYLSEGVAEYQKRLRPFAQVEIREIREERVRDGASRAELEQALAREGERLLALVPPESWLYVLDVRGRALSSEELAADIAAHALRGQSSLAFLVGSAFGISRGVREAAGTRLSLSPMTFTHQMARLLLVEQLYRAFKINRGEKYHW